MAEYISLTGVSSGSSNTDIKMTATGDVIGRVFIKEHDMALIAGAMRFWTMYHHGPQNLTDSERQFHEQKRLFEQIPPLFLEPYRGLFVISRNGEIVDADADLDTLTERFFGEHGDVPIYLDKIGGQLREVIDTHF